MSEFKRENRYIVLKRSDIDRYLSMESKRELLEICEQLQQGRLNDDRADLKCVIVESDWPEYEAVWDMIESRILCEKED